MSMNPVNAGSPAAFNKSGRSLEGLAQLFDQVSQALISGDPQALEGACTALRNELAAWTDTPPDVLKSQPMVAQKLKQLGALLGQQRAVLARRSALVDRTLQSLLPAEQAAAYGIGQGSAIRGAHRAGAYTSLKA